MSSQKSELPIHTNGHATAPHPASQTTHQPGAPQEKRAVAKPHLGKVTDAERSFEVDPYASPAIYYGEDHAPRKPKKSRTLSAIEQRRDKVNYNAPARRTSHDAQGNIARRYLINVEDTMRLLLSREDTDGNVQITIEDSGPKTLSLGTAASGGYHHFDVRGTYMLSNLLQELTLAKQYGRKQIVLDEARLNENPVNRLARLIKDSFWPNLTRRIDGSNIAKVGKDPKDWTADPRPRIYIPRGAPEQHEYYTRIAQEHPTMRLDVRWLNEKCDDNEYVRDLNEAPGLLAVAMERIADTPEGKPDYRGLPFVVPGGRFNELYGWDSYMETLGLLVNDREDLCEGMVKHFCFCIRHYGKILNANRTYYLCRSQPPFLTDMALRVYDRIKHKPGALDFLREAILAAIKDYHNTWMSHPRYDDESGLSKYVPGGMGVPPETEASHFVHVLEPYAKKHGMTFKEFVKAYNYGHVFEPELDEYFLHDRAVRESGHDTSYRLEKVAANLATVDLNSCLYKIEMDIARTIRSFFGDRLPVPKEWRTHDMKEGHFEVSSTWDRRARKRRQQMDKLMWDEEEGMFFDYDTKLKMSTGYESATTFWAMWAGACTTRQATVMVSKALPKFETHGGLVSGTEKSRGPVGLSRPNRQWDYPFGWAPQQILAWTGLLRFGFEEEAQRLAYRWVYMVTKAFVDFNGVVVEKYDVTSQVDPHRVTAEYGNQGSDFKGVATEGFGWVNASYVYALQIVNAHMKRALGAITSWDTFKKMTSEEYEIEDHGHRDRATTNNAIHAASQQVAHPGSGTAKPGTPNGRSSLLDAHTGPQPASAHASGASQSHPQAPEHTQQSKSVPDPSTHPAHGPSPSHPTAEHATQPKPTQPAATPAPIPAPAPALAEHTIQSKATSLPSAPAVAVSPPAVSQTPAIPSVTPAQITPAQAALSKISSAQPATKAVSVITAQAVPQRPVTPANNGLPIPAASQLPTTPVNTVPVPATPQKAAPPSSTPAQPATSPASVLPTPTPAIVINPPAPTSSQIAAAHLPGKHEDKHEEKHVETHNDMHDDKHEEKHIVTHEDKYDQKLAEKHEEKHEAPHEDKHAAKHVAPQYHDASTTHTHGPHQKQHDKQTEVLDKVWA